MVNQDRKISGKNVLITGGAGFLGSNLARRLVTLGAKVTINTLPGENRANLSGIEDKVQIIEGKINSNGDPSQLINDQDYLFHFAWQTNLQNSIANPLEDFYSDVGGILSILDSCKKHNPGIKIVFPSTATVFGNPTSLPVSEDEGENPNSPYDFNKLVAEKALRFYFHQHGIKSTSLRLANVFGEYQRIDNPARGILNFFIGRALKGETITLYGDGELVRDYSYVSNFVDAFLAAAESAQTDGKSYVVGSGEGRSFNEVARGIQRLAMELYGKKVEVTHLEYPKDTHPVNLRNFIADSSRFKADSEWNPQIKFEEGLKRTMEFYKNG